MTNLKGKDHTTVMAFAAELFHDVHPDDYEALAARVEAAKQRRYRTARWIAWLDRYVLGQHKSQVKTYTTDLLDWADESPNRLVRELARWVGRRVPQAWGELLRALYTTRACDAPPVGAAAVIAPARAGV